jgi:hypothetical protein
VLRSLAYALLDRGGARENPSEADLPADRPFRENLETIALLEPEWRDGKVNADGTRELLQTLRTASASEASKLTVQLLNRGVGPRSIFDGLFDYAGELLVQTPGIVAVHAMTFTNAAHYAWHRTRSEETRRLLLLQNAAFLPLYRGNPRDQGQRIDALEPLATSARGEEAVAEVFAEISTDRLTAARKVLGYLRDHGSARPLADAARRLIFLKGTNSHDYKFSSAVLEDFDRLSPMWRDRMLAASVFYLRGSGDRDNALVQRTRAALDA